jgi:uridine kinase
VKQVIELLGKTVKFVHTENERFFEEQGQITEIVLSLSGEHQISINNDDFYILKNLLEFEIV